jgi:hypothetical protein
MADGLGGERREVRMMTKLSQIGKNELMRDLPKGMEHVYIGAINYTVEEAALRLDMGWDKAEVAKYLHDAIASCMNTVQEAAKRRLADLIPVSNPEMDKPMKCDRCGHIFESVEMEELGDDIYCGACHDHLMLYTAADAAEDKGDREYHRRVDEGEAI